MLCESFDKHLLEQILEYAAWAIEDVCIDQAQVREVLRLAEHYGKSRIPSQLLKDLLLAPNPAVANHILSQVPNLPAGKWATVCLFGTYAHYRLLVLQQNNNL